MLRPLALVVVAVYAWGCDSAEPPPIALPSVCGPEGCEVDPAAVAVSMRRVADYQLAAFEATPATASWIDCAFFVGLAEAAEALDAPAYREAVRGWAEGNGWGVWPDAFNADHLCAGQVYAGLPEPRRLASVVRSADALVASDARGREVWSWVDALFMAPPTLARLAAATGDRRYAERLDAWVWDADAHLFDPSDGLYYRDSRYFGAVAANGQPVFWSRGNGWAMAGLARVADALPADDPLRARYVDRVGTLAEALLPLQQADGHWRSNLLDPTDPPGPESSGTALFAYGLAWGVNRGQFGQGHRESAARAWLGLEAAIQPDGRIGWVQGVGRDPQPATASETAPYGAGALLLAGSEVLRMLRPTSEAASGQTER